LFPTTCGPRNIRCLETSYSVKLQENRVTRHSFPRVNVSRGPCMTRLLRASCESDWSSPPW
jgi:hypothetical protein